MRKKTFNSYWLAVFWIFVSVLFFSCTSENKFKGNSKAPVQKQPQTKSSEVVVAQSTETTTEIEVITEVPVEDQIVLKDLIYYRNSGKDMPAMRIDAGNPAAVCDEGDIVLGVTEVNCTMDANHERFNNFEGYFIKDNKVTLACDAENNGTNDGGYLEIACLKKNGSLEKHLTNSYEKANKSGTEPAELSCDINDRLAGIVNMYCGCACGATGNCDFDHNSWFLTEKTTAKMGCDFQSAGDFTPSRGAFAIKCLKISEVFDKMFYEVTKYDGNESPKPASEAKGLDCNSGDYLVGVLSAKCTKDKYNNNGLGWFSKEKAASCVNNEQYYGGFNKILCVKGSNIKVNE